MTAIKLGFYYAKAALQVSFINNITVIGHDDKISISINYNM